MDEFEKLVDELNNEETTNERKSEIAWDLLRSYVNFDHGLFVEDKQMNMEQIEQITILIKLLLKNGATLGMIAMDIKETLGDNFEEHK